jgi:hypothetical protein
LIWLCVSLEIAEAPLMFKMFFFMNFSLS